MVKENPLNEISDKFKLQLNLDYIVEHLTAIGYNGVVKSIKRDKPFTAVLFDSYSRPYIVVDYSRGMTNNIIEYKGYAEQLYNRLIKINGKVN